MTDGDVHFTASDKGGSEKGVSPQTPTDEAVTPAMAPVSPPTDALTPTPDFAVGEEGETLNVVSPASSRFYLFCTLYTVDS